jgi:hypothetical protein
MAFLRRAHIPRAAETGLLRPHSGSPPQRLAPSAGNAENSTALFVCAILTQNPVPQQLLEKIRWELINSIGVVFNFGGAAILPSNANVIPVPIVSFLDEVIFPGRDQLQELNR